MFENGNIAERPLSRRDLLAGDAERLQQRLAKLQAKKQTLRGLSPEVREVEVSAINVEIDEAKRSIDTINAAIRRHNAGSGVESRIQEIRY